MSKLEGEHGVLNAKGKAAIIRTSWVFDGTGKNFLTTMLRLADSRDNLSIVADQIGRPTFCGHLADATLTITDALITGQETAEGIFHVTGSGPVTNWAEFASEIFKLTKTSKISIRPISTQEYPTAAARPAYSVLDLERYQSTFNKVMPDWRDGLRHALKDRKTGSITK